MVDPCLPSELKGFEVTRRYRGAVYHITVKNPDGSVVVIRNVGNEKIHYTVTEDEELVVRDSLGFWNYADSAGKSTGIRAHRRGDREKGEREFLQRHNSKEAMRKLSPSLRIRTTRLQAGELSQPLWNPVTITSTNSTRIMPITTLCGRMKSGDWIAKVQLLTLTVMNTK